ncbi:MAG TPA: glycosyltransferase family 87 protein, partial [Candidatus Polarisedimenticolia bacterium]|nr:glycosyltransferase family 87 protein [Candidatus Polarisedimenticolia bacterium]
MLVHSVGHFAYMGLWRHLAAPDFDVNDFKAYYTAALAVRTGQADRFLYSDPGLMNLGLLPEQPWVQFAVANGIPHPSAYIYPPFFAVALAPLTLMDYHTANQAWFGLNTLLLAGSILLLVRLAALPWPGVPTAGGVSPARAGGGAMAAACVVFVSLNFFPTIRAMQCGQAGPLLLLLTTVGLYAALRGRDALAGGALAIAAAVKLTPAILLVYLWWAGRRRAALWGAGVLVLLTLVAVFAAGWDNHVRYASEFVPTLSKGAATYANQSINGALNRLLTGASMAQFEFSQEPALVRFLTRAIGLLLLGAALFIARPRARETSPGSRLALGYGLVTLTTL